MFQELSSRITLKKLFSDKTGSLASDLGGITLLVAGAGILAAVVLSDMAAVSTIATKAERRAVISALVGDKHATTSWGTPEDPHTEVMTLPNGHEVEVTTWRERTPTSTTYTAVAPISASADAVDCSGPMDVARAGCVYATRTHADDLEALHPEALVRMDASMDAADAAGTVDARVATTTSIPQGTDFASGASAEENVWRYLVEANVSHGSGEIRIMQADKTLALVPITSELKNYYGTFTAGPDIPVVATVTSGNAVVKTIYIYRAGGTS